MKKHIRTKSVNFDEIQKQNEMYIKKSSILAESMQRRTTNTGIVSENMRYNQNFMNENDIKLNCSYDVKNCNDYDNNIKAPSEPGSENNESNAIKGSEEKLNESAYLCCVCFDRPPDAVIMNCGHGGICYKCCMEQWMATEECYLCRQHVVQVLQYDIKTWEDDALKVITATQMVSDSEDNPCDKGIPSDPPA